MWSSPAFTSFFPANSATWLAHFCRTGVTYIWPFSLTHAWWDVLQPCMPHK
jgi:hypothetical protein